jgi:hypothetical protein
MTTQVLRISLVAFLLAGAGAGAWLSPRRIQGAARERISEWSRWLNAETTRSRATVCILIWLVALVPMLHLTWLVRHYAVDVPTLDDWEMAPLIVDAQTGHLKWASIFSQQQEARTVLPKLIFILFAADGHWDVRDQMTLSVGCCWLTAAGIFILLRRSGLRMAALAIPFWIAALTIFTPAKFELWIFASGFPSFFPALFLVTALVVAGSARLALGTKFVLCALLATASSFTLANGLLAWGLTFPAVLVMERPARWRSWLAGWLAVTGLCAAAYFWGYQKPADLTAFAPAVSWLDYAAFISEFLGGGLAYALKGNPSVAATIFGGAQLALFLIAAVYFARRLNDGPLLARAVPWFALAFHSIGSAVLASLGRVGYGAPYALASRYVTFSVYLTIGLAGLLAMMSHEMLRSSPSARLRRWTYAVCLLLVVAYLIPYKVCAANSRFFLRALSAKDRLARAAVLLCRAIDTREVITKTAYPNDARPVTDGADALDRLSLLRPPLIRTNRVDAIPHENSDTGHASGACEAIAPQGDLIHASGWAALDAKGRPADCVAIAYQTQPGTNWVLCAISDSFAMRPEIVKRFHSMEQLWSGWSATFPRAAFPEGATLSFWAMDADAPRLYRLRDPVISAQ